MFRFVRRNLGRKFALLLLVVAVAIASTGIWLSGEEMNARQMYVLGGAVIGALAAVLLGLRELVTGPLARLSKVMRRAEAGDFLVRARVESVDEIGEVARTFNVMLAKITDMAVDQIDSARQTEMLERELSLQAELAAKSEELTERVKELSLLSDITHAISSSLELGEVLSKITQMVGVTLGFNEFSLLLYDPAAREYVVTETYGFADTGGGDVEGLRFKETEGLISMMHERQETVSIPDTTKEPRYLHYKGQRMRDGSALVVPMAYRDRLVGAFAFNRPELDAFTDSDIRILETAARTAALAIVNAQLHEQTVELAITDALTGLSNRRHLERRLEMEFARAERFEHSVSVIMIDIDHFKAYNDQHGHPKGDQVLKQLAGVLREQVRSIDTLARYGGEEFTLILPRSKQKRALEVAEKLRAAVEAAHFPGEETQPLGKVTLSLGVACYPDDADTRQALIDRADAALYLAKDGGRNRTVGYKPGMAATTDAALS